MSTSLPYYLAWICLIHLSIFAGILFFKKDNRKANRILGLFMLILAYIHFTHLLIFTGTVYRAHWLNELCFLLLYFEGPLYLQYTAFMTGDRIDWKRRFWAHLLPFVPPLFFVVNFAFRDTAQIHSYYAHALTQQPPEAMFLLFVVTVQMTCYMTWSLRLLRAYNQRIRHESYHAIMNLRWLSVLTLLLLGFSLVGVPILLALIHSDVSALYIYMPVITMAIYLTLFYKSINFPGTEYEKKLIREQEREKISRDIHDEIGAGITRIALLSEIAKREHHVDQEQLNEISGNARKLAEHLKEIIWGLNPQNDSLEHLLVHIREYTTGFLDDAGIRWDIQYPDAVPDLRVSHELRRNICMLLKEALHNIVRHADADLVTLMLTVESDRFSLIISDNGKSFDEHHILPGNGLKNMRKRVELSGGHFSINTDIGKGTSLCIKEIPLVNQSRSGWAFSL